MEWESNLEKKPYPKIRKNRKKNQNKIAACEQISSKKQKSMSKYLMRAKKTLARKPVNFFSQVQTFHSLLQPVEV